MARIAGVDIPDNKRIEISLTYIRGVGRPLSNRILQEVKVNPDTRAKDLSAEELAEIRKIIERDYPVEGELLRQVRVNVKRLVDIGSYRGVRHQKGLPVHGQRTRTNARTRRGKRQVVNLSSIKKEESH